MGWYEGTQYDITVPPDLRKILRQRKLMEEMKARQQWQSLRQSSAPAEDQAVDAQTLQSGQPASQDQAQMTAEDMAIALGETKRDRAISGRDSGRSASDLLRLQAMRLRHQREGTGQYAASNKIEQMKKRRELEKRLSTVNIIGPPA